MFFFSSYFFNEGFQRTSRSSLTNVEFSPSQLKMRDALNHYAKHMAKNAHDTWVEQAGSVAKKPRTDYPHSKETSVPSTTEIAVQEHVKQNLDEHTASSSDSDSENAETTKTVKLRTLNSSFVSQCREKMRSSFVPLRPEDDENCKLKFSVNGNYFAGVKPFNHTPLQAKVFAAAIEIKRVKKGLNQTFLSPGMLVQLYDDSSNLNYIVHDILCYPKEPHRSTVSLLFLCFLMVFWFYRFFC